MAIFKRIRQIGRGTEQHRGGSWNNTPRNARCSVRNRNIPDNRNNNIGFRVVFSTARKG
ncbi:MAG: hypothetical protein D3925_20350 [Candidatus Electrothrix sp. AR5]|nr:hypothetical protein [Candidatus Electrothrix sp. AR5]